MPTLRSKSSKPALAVARAFLVAKDPPSTAAEALKPGCAPFVVIEMTPPMASLP